MLRVGFYIFISIVFFSCTTKKLSPVTVMEFATFIKQTNYVTDAEKFGWSFVQKDVYNYEIVEDIDWRCPDGFFFALPENPVTQVSYNDAAAYVKWAHKKLPNYHEYWDIVNTTDKKINAHAPIILPANQVNLIGNVWEITLPDQTGRIRLAGGSYLCNQYTCNGTQRQRELYVDQTTSNSHISFAVLN